MTRFLNGPVLNLLLVAGIGLSVYYAATLTERGEPGAGVAQTESARFTGAGDAGSSPAAGDGVSARPGPRSLNVAYHRHSYPVDFRHRWILEKAHRLRTNTKLKAERAYAQRLLRELRHVRTVQAHVETRPPHYDAWLCIHRYEGVWDANTGNGFFGGLQMDIGFQRAYGAELLDEKGTADHWTPLEQMWAAERAYRSGRGYTPWPNTARMCGLL